MPANGKPNGRFELPALTPISYSLTDGTDIPPPTISPIEEKAPPPPPPAIAKPEPAQPTQPTQPTKASPVATNGHNGTTNGAYDGRGRTSAADVPPASPSSTTRPSSIRRLFSRKSLNTGYTNGNGSDEHLDASKIVRPDSSLSFLDRPGKKNGNWLKRLSSAAASNRSSVIYETPPQSVPVQAPVKKGPPPPKLPELNQLRAKVQNDDGSLGGGDMFNNIK